MKLMKSMQAAFIAVFLCLGVVGCSTLETLGDFVKENPIKSSFAFRYATAKYIERKPTEEGQKIRSHEVATTTSKVLTFIDNNPRVSVDDVMDYLDKSIDWGSMDAADRMLVLDILTIAKSELSAYETTNPLVNVRELLQTVLSAAMIYSRG